MNELTITEIKEIASHATKGGLFGMPSAEAAFSLMMLCQADGLHPMQAMRKYHIIKGRPSMRAEAMLADFQANGGKIQWNKRTDEECSATFSHPSGGELTVVWTIERAKKAGLTGNPTWAKFPQQMLSARCISEGVRAVFPAVVCGVYTPEEVEDFDSKPIRNVTPSEPTPVTPSVVETVKVVEAEVVEEKPVETATKAVDMANKIKAVRLHLVKDLNYKTVNAFRSATLQAIGRECDNLASLSSEELDKMIDFNVKNGEN